jgi:NADH-quinone oxidoreductase subunit C
VSPAELAERLGPRFPDVVVARGEVAVIVDVDGLLEALAWLRNERALAFGFLSDVTATHWPRQRPEFWVAYSLYSLEHRHRARVKVGLRQAEARLPSVTHIWPAANFMEREVYDFYGISFDGHPDLRRILLPDDWEGHPLLKTEELGGVNTRFKGGAFIPPVDRRTM